MTNTNEFLREIEGLQSRDDQLYFTLKHTPRQEGAVPSMFLDALDRMISEEKGKRLWERRGLPFREFIVSDLEIPIDEFTKIYELRHKDERDVKEVAQRMAAMRKQVGRLLDGELGDKGGDRKSDDYKSNEVTSLDYKSGSDTPYIRARLKRDEPHLYEQVANGTLTAAAAGHEAGFIKKRQTFVVGDVEQTARQIKKYFTPDQLQELKELL